MKALTITFVACIAALGTITAASAQNHDLKPAEALQKLSFMKGNWTGKQDFNIPNGKMVGEASNQIDDAIGGRYLCEMLSTTISGRKPTDTRHFITYDAKAGKFKAWWYTDTSVGPMEFEGDLVGESLVLTTKPMEGRPILRASYATPSAKTLTYTLEMKQGTDWTKLFVTTYTKK